MVMFAYKEKACLRVVSGTLLKVLSSYFPRFMIATAVGPVLLKPRQWLGVPQNPTKGTYLLYAVHIAICLLLPFIFGKVTPARFLCSKKRRHSCAMDTFRPCPLRCTCFSKINSSMSRAPVPSVPHVHRHRNADFPHPFPDH